MLGQNFASRLTQSLVSKLGTYHLSKHYVFALDDILDDPPAQ